MAASTNPIFFSTARNWTAKIDAPAGTTPQVVATAGAEGSLMDAGSICSSDAADQVVDVFLHDGSATYQIGAISVPATAGTVATVPPVNLFDGVVLPWISDERTIRLAAGHTLQIAAKQAITGELLIVCHGGDY